MNFRSLIFKRMNPVIVPALYPKYTGIISPPNPTLNLRMFSSLAKLPIENNVF